MPSLRNSIDGMTRPAWMERDLKHVVRVGGDQIPVDRACEQRIDMLIPEGAARAVEHRVRDASHAWHEFDREQAAEAEDGLALTVRVGMQNVRLYLRNIFDE